MPWCCPATKISPMVQLAIRCQPRVPVSADELDGWLEHEVSSLRAEAPHGIIRLSRLTQGLPCAIGWLVELELAEGERLLAEDRLAGVLRDMRLLGLQPTLLAPTRQDARSPGSSSSLGPTTNGAGR